MSEISDIFIFIIPILLSLFAYYLCDFSRKVLVGALTVFLTVIIIYSRNIPDDWLIVPVLLLVYLIWSQYGGGIDE